MVRIAYLPTRLFVFFLASFTISSLLATTAQASSSDLVTLLQNVSTADGHRYNTLDDQGVGLDTAKIIPSSQGGYLAVYHHLIGNVFQVRLATSTDLLQWHYVATLENAASQPTISTLSDGGYLLAFEKSGVGAICGGSGSCLAFRHYGDLSHLVAGNDDLRVAINRTLSTCHEGTPNFYAATLSPDIAHSIINVGFHYHQAGSGSSCDVDRQALGTLTNFSTWTAQVDSSVNTRFDSLGTIHGSVGDRDSFFYQGNPYSLIEAQSTKNDFSTWRPYLLDRQHNSLTALSLQTALGSTSFGNPTYTELRLPLTGNPLGFVSTEFVFSEGSKPGEAGALTYYTAYPTQPSPDTAPPSISITQPANGSRVRRGTTVTIGVNASDNVGVAKVAFYVNGALICVGQFVPYSCNWTVPLASGVAYTITARATDTSSNTAQSSVTVRSR